MFYKLNLAAKGFTLIELMIGLVITMFIVLISMDLYMTSYRHYRLHSTLTNIKNAAHLVASYLSTSIRQAGYSGDSYLKQMQNNLIGSPSQTNCLALISKQSLKFGVTGSNSIASDYQCLDNKRNKQQNKYLRGDILTSQFADKYISERIYPKQIYIANRLLTNQLFFGRQLKQVTQNNRQIASHILSIRAIHSQTFYIGENKNHQCNKLTIPGLVRMTISKNGNLRREYIVKGIEQLKFKFIVQNQSSSKVLRLLSANQVANWQQVIAVVCWWVVRSQCPFFATATLSKFQFFDFQFTKNDKYLRRTFSLFIKIRNK